MFRANKSVDQVLQNLNKCVKELGEIQDRKNAEAFEIADKIKGLEEDHRDAMEESSRAARVCGKITELIS